jgi:hypothetical protein
MHSHACEMRSQARRTSDSDGGNVFSSRRGDHCNSLPQNGDRCIMAPFYEIGRIFIRFHSAHPQKEKRFVGLGRFSHSPTIVPICHTASFTHWSYETQNQNQVLRNVFFYTRLASPSWVQPVTHAHRRTSPIASASLKITYAFYREPSRPVHISSLCIQVTLTLLLPLYICTRSRT